MDRSAIWIFLERNRGTCGPGRTGCQSSISSCASQARGFALPQRAGGGVGPVTEIPRSLHPVVTPTLGRSLWGRGPPSAHPCVAALWSLRDLSVARGQDPPRTDQPPPEIRRSAKHLI